MYMLAMMVVLSQQFVVNVNTLCCIRLVILLCSECVCVCVCVVVCVCVCMCVRVCVCVCVCVCVDIGQMVVAKVLSRYYAGRMLYGQSIVYYEHCVLLARQLRDKRLEGEFLELLGSHYT